MHVYARELFLLALCFFRLEGMVGAGRSFLI